MKIGTIVTVPDSVYRRPERVQGTNYRFKVVRRWMGTPGYWVVQSVTGPFLTIVVGAENLS